MPGGERRGWWYRDLEDLGGGDLAKGKVEGWRLDVETEVETGHGGNSSYENTRRTLSTVPLFSATDVIPGPTSLTSHWSAAPAHITRYRQHSINILLVGCALAFIRPKFQSSYFIIANEWDFGFSRPSVS